MTARDEVRELRATIAAITGRPTVSTSLKHLRTRLATLRDHAAMSRAREVGAVAGHLAGSFVADLGVDRLAVLDRMAKTMGAAPSAVLARAIDELAVRMGLGVEVERAKKRGRP